MTRRRAAGFAAGAVAVAGYLAVTRFGLGGERAMVAVEDFGEALAAVAAAVACTMAARRGGAAQWAWVLFAASSTVWALGESVWSVYEVGLGVGVPFPSLADVGFLASIPLGVAAILALPTSPRTLNGALRLVVDSAIVASALIFVGWGVGLSELYGQAAIEQQGRLLVLAYPAGDIVILTLVAAALPGAARQLRTSVGVLGLAFLGMLFADGSFAYLMLRGDYGVLGGAGDVGWIAGYGLVAAAAMSSGKSLRAARLNGDQELRLWQLGIPWLGVLTVIVASLWMSTSGRAFGPALGYIGSTVGVLFIGSQALAIADSALLLRRSRRAEEQLRERTTLLAEVIARAPLGIARIDADLRFVDANPRLGEMLMVPARLLAGAPLAQFLADDEMERVHERAGTMQSGDLEHVEVDSEMLVSGQRLFVHRTVTPVLDDAGSFRYFLVMFEDVTAKHEQEQAALANLAALERLSRLKSEFMSMVSHEFRTALTGIQGFSELMSSEEVAPVEVKEFAGDINADAMRLNRMITEMLDLDRIESGRMAMHMAPVDLNRLLSDAVERAQMTTDKHKIVVALDSALPMVEGDADRLTQVVTNLLSNAIKYSPEGGQIVVTSRRDGGNAEVSVRDHGQGIPAEFITRIFGRYERYDGGRSQPVGTGLGLAIAQQILQLHSGRIWVESTPGHGADFKFALPIAVQAPVETR
jgi:two-component system, sensor histidine kinase and response regulator